MTANINVSQRNITSSTVISPINKHYNIYIYTDSRTCPIVKGQYVSDLELRTTLQGI